MKPCISRFGSSVRNDLPNTPMLKLTDSVSGNSKGEPEELEPPSRVEKPAPAAAAA